MAAGGRDPREEGRRRRRPPGWEMSSYGAAAFSRYWRDRSFANLCLLLLLVVSQSFPSLVAGDDVTHEDGSLHTSPVCNNKFRLVRAVLQ